MITWASVLTEEQLARVEAELVTVDMVKGDFVCRKGEPAKHWVGVIDGLVKLSSVHSSGKATTYFAVPTSGWFGEGSLQRCAPISYDAVAMRNSRIAYLPRSTFFWLQEVSVEFNRLILRLLAERLFQLLQLLEYDRILPATSRVARCLVGMFNPLMYPGIDLRFTMSQEEIGNLVGLSRQSVNHALKNLRKAGLVRIAYCSVTVVDVEGLKQFEENNRLERSKKIAGADSKRDMTDAKGTA